jgi:hypothetical protein
MRYEPEAANRCNNEEKKNSNFVEYLVQPSGGGALHSRRSRLNRPQQHIPIERSFQIATCARQRFLNLCPEAGAAGAALTHRTSDA